MIDIYHYISFRCTIRFSICRYREITTVSLVTLHHEKIVMKMFILFFLVMQTCFTLFSNFQIHNPVLLTTVPMLNIVSPWPILIEVCAFWFPLPVWPTAPPTSPLAVTSPFSLSLCFEQDSTLFNGWILSHCVYILHLFYPFIYWTLIIDYFHILAVVNNAAVSIA